MNVNLGQKPKAASPRTPGMMRAAKALGISRETLRQVLQGKKTANSDRILAEYQALQPKLKASPNNMTKEEFQAQVLAGLNEVERTVDRINATMQRTGEVLKETLEVMRSTAKNLVEINSGPRS